MPGRPNGPSGHNRQALDLSLQSFSDGVNCSRRMDGIICIHPFGAGRQALRPVKNPLFRRQNEFWGIQRS